MSERDDIQLRLAHALAWVEQGKPAHVSPEHAFARLHMGVPQTVNHAFAADLIDAIERAGLELRVKP